MSHSEIRKYSIWEKIGLRIAKYKTGLKIDGITRRDFDNYDKQKIEIDEKFQNVFWKAIEEMPHFVASRRKSGLYRIEMPDGIQGSLMRLQNGGNTTAVIGDDGKIIGQASLFSAGQSASQIISNIFSVASVITGTYYLNSINKHLAETNKKLNKIYQWLNNDKVAKIMEIGETLLQIYNEYTIHESKTTNFNQIKTIVREIKQDINFYCLQLKDKLESLKNKSDLKSEVERNLDECEYSVSMLNQLHDILAFSLVLELLYSQNHNAEYISLIKEQYKNYREKIKDIIHEAEDVLPKYIKERHTTWLEKIGLCGIEILTLPFNDLLLMLMFTKAIYDKRKDKLTSKEIKQFEEDFEKHSLDEKNYEEKIEYFFKLYSSPCELLISKDEVYLARKAV